MPTSLQGIAKKAQSQKRYRFRNLYGMLNEELLRESWREIKKHAASGVDQISAQDYEQHLEENIRDLVERLKQKRYRAKLVKRHYIPKGNGKLRPLGIPMVPSYCTSILGDLGITVVGEWTNRSNRVATLA
jgi:RNA-directed DNA polymerase